MQRPGQPRGADGDLVRLYNSRGACLAIARIDPLVSTGIAVLPTGAWLTQLPQSGLDIAGNPNILTADIPTSSFGQGSAAYTCLVQVERIDAAHENAMTRYDAGLRDLIRQ